MTVTYNCPYIERREARIAAQVQEGLALRESCTIQQLIRIAGPNLMLPLKTEELFVFLTQEIYRLGR